MIKKAQAKTVPTSAVEAADPPKEESKSKALVANRNFRANGVFYAKGEKVHLTAAELKTYRHFTD